MERSREERRRGAKTAAAASVTGSAVLVAMALYAAIHPQVAPLVNYPPDPQVGAANSDVLWPALVAVLALVASVAILRRPGRLSYLASGGVNLLMVGFALTVPSSSMALEPLAVLLGVIGVVGLVVSAAGWAIATPLPQAQPRWPTHHEDG